MHTVHENQMAFDPAALGFPSILGCQAICFHTSRGLYGFHDAKSGSQGRTDLKPTDVSTAKLGVFATWVTKEFQTGEKGIALYGIINRDEQYNPDASGNADWKAVLLGLAGNGALGFTGDVFGRVSTAIWRRRARKRKSRSTCSSIWREINAPSGSSAGRR